MRVLIVGCGYIGLPLGAELVNAGHQVFGLRRDPRAEVPIRSAGIEFLHCDITKSDQLARLPADYDWVIDCVSSSGGNAEAYRAVYLEGCRNMIAWVAKRPPQKFLYTSSTSVYGQTDGSVVTESSSTEPASALAKILIETEQVLLAPSQTQKVPVVILRLAG